GFLAGRFVIERLFACRSAAAAPPRQAARPDQLYGVGCSLSVCSLTHAGRRTRAAGMWIKVEQPPAFGFKPSGPRASDQEALLRPLAPPLARRGGASAFLRPLPRLLGQLSGLGSGSDDEPLELLGRVHAILDGALDIVLL